MCDKFILILIRTHHLNYFFSLVLASNNSTLKIYCKSIVKILWYHFVILIFNFIFPLSLFSSSTHFFIIFSSFFLLHTRITSLLSDLYLHFWLFFLLFSSTGLPLRPLHIPEHTNVIYILYVKNFERSGPPHPPPPLVNIYISTLLEMKSPFYN